MNVNINILIRETMTKPVVRRWESKESVVKARYREEIQLQDSNGRESAMEEVQ